jgi:amino acid transporter
LHPRYRTPVNSITFVAVVTLVFAIGSLLGVGAQEAFQLIDNAAGIFYAIAYLVLFAIPLFGISQLSSNAPLWLRAAAVVGVLVTLLYLVLTVVPIVPVESRAGFATKLIATTLLSNALGAVIFFAAEKRGHASASSG